MRTISYRAEDLKKVVIELGFVGENEHTQVIIDCTKTFAEYPEAVPTMKVQPPKGTAYPRTVTREGNCVIWTVMDGDLAERGRGEIQLTFTNGTKICKTYVGKTNISRSIVGSGPVPSGIQDFLDEANEALENLESAEVHQPIIDDNGYWNTWDQETGEYVATETKAQGEDGQPGQDGQDGTDATPDLITVPYEYLTFPVAAGTKCYHGGKLYEANQEIQTSEQWTAAHWTETTVEEQLGQLKSALTSISDAITKTVESKNLINPNTLITGRLQSDGTVNSMSNYRTSDYIPIETGKKYIFARESLTSAGSAMIKGYAGYGFYDSSKTWVANSRVWDNDTVGVALTFTASANGYVRVCGETNFFTSDTSGLYILQEGETLDGYEAWHLPQKVVDVLTGETIVQSTGSETDKVMSQKAVTDLVNTAVPDGTEEVVNDFHIAVGKNKYNKDACNPQNSKYYDGTTGAVGDGNQYAITGKMPVKAETRYVFSTTEKALKYSRAAYYSGADGSTFISREAINGASFVTPQNCTFVGFDMFAATHTSEEYDAAIAAAQLEEGAIPTSYEAYTEKLVLSVDNVEGGSSLTTVEAITKEQSQVNLYDKSLAKNGKYYNQGVENSDAGWAVTGKIPVLPNTQYNLSKDPSAPLSLLTAYSEYDESGTWLRSITAGYTYLVPITTDSDTYFISVNMQLASHTQQDFEDTIDTLMLCYGTSRPYSYSAYNPVPVVKTQSMENAYAENVDRFKGKKWLALGTSITWYDGKAYQLGLNTGEICRGYVGQVARNKNLLVTNEGINGSTLGDYDSSSLINRYQSLDFEHADICTIEYGVNDLGKDIPVGTESDAAGDTTFAACLKTVIEYALAENPQMILVICTDPDVRGTTLNNNNNTLKDFTDVTLAIAKQYRLPVCDWYYQSGINALNKGDSTKDWMTADGTHPNDFGHNRMGAMLNRIFDSLLC